MFAISTDTVGNSLGVVAHRALRAVAFRLPDAVVKRLNVAQFEYPALGKILRMCARSIADGPPGTIQRGHGAGLIIDASGRNAGYRIGTADRHEQEFIASVLREGDIFYDIGANIGFFTLIGAKLVGPSGQSVAFEPLPDNLAQLERNVAANSLRQVRAVGAAVSARAGRMQFGNASDRRDAARLASVPGKPFAGIEVDVVSVDGWRAVTGEPPPQLLKIDVEGAEIDVLRGAAATLREHRPVVLVEVHWLGDSFTNYVRDEILPLGYTCTDLAGGPIPEERGHFHAVLMPA